MAVFRDGAEIIDVVIAPGQQGGASWGAERGGMKIVVAQAIARKALRGRHVYGAAEYARLAKSHVVDQDDNYVWGIGWRLDLETRWGFGLAGVNLGDVWILGLGDRQNGAVHSSVLCGQRDARDNQR